MPPEGTSRWIERHTDDGSFTLAHPVHGETYHSLSGAWTQARERYAADGRIRERALELARAGRDRLRLLDIGTGLGLNLAAALEALDGTGVVLEATSLERDPELLAHAADRPREPASLERWHAHVRAALRAALQSASHGTTSAGVPLCGGRLRLLIGDAHSAWIERGAGAAVGSDAACDTVFDDVYDAVFLDPFSPRVEPDLWARPFLARIAARMAPGSVLSTYSAATDVRAGLAAAGLRIGRGARVGEKREGTLASPDRELPPLDPRVRRRIESRARDATRTAGFAAPAQDPRDPIP